MAAVETVLPQPWWGFCIQSKLIWLNMHMVVLCVVFVASPFLATSCEALTHLLQDCSTGTGAIIWLPQCWWSNSEEYGPNLKYQTPTKHDTKWIMSTFHGIYCKLLLPVGTISENLIVSPYIYWVELLWKGHGHLLFTKALWHFPLTYLYFIIWYC